jgi:uncharacterized linocin/CFP29 family protein
VTETNRGAEHLRRDLAPISTAAWAEIEEQAKLTLQTFLAARKLLDFSGPHGYAHAAVPLGRSTALTTAIRDGAQTRVRKLQPLTELRVPFTLSREEIDDIDRGAKDPDLAPLVDAARTIALAEDQAVFHGYAPAHIQGIMEASEKSRIELTDAFDAYPKRVVEAMHKLRSAGIGGPYALALGPRCYDGMPTTFSPGGYPVIRVVDELIDGPLVWAPAINGAVVLSLRGGDFELTVGQDLSIGYLGHDDHEVRLYLEETFTFRCLAPEAAIPLRYAS